MTAARPIGIITSDPTLAEQLQARLETLLARNVTILDGWRQTTAGDLVITTTTACSPDECAGLTHSGVAVVVLAALPSDFQERNYRLAGAAGYLAMNLDTEPLAEIVQGLAPVTAAAVD